MGRIISGEEKLLNYFPIDLPQTSLPSFPIDQPQKSLPSLPQQIRASSEFSQRATLKGFRYKDNKSKYRWEDGKNGIARLTFDSFLPPTMTVCMRGRFLYNRHGDTIYWFNVIIKKREPRPGTIPIDFGVLSRSNGEMKVESRTIIPFIRIVMNKEEQDKAKEAKSWPSRNNIRKWMHICVVGDFTNDKTTLFLNGKKINEKELKFSKSFPDDYFSEELRSSGKILSGFSVEFGRYPYDKIPIIGDLVDINAWDRPLEEKEMEAITNCTSLRLGVGNLFNMTSPFNVTGPLCQPIEVDMKELSCEYAYRKDILLPVHANSFSAAGKQCDRLLKNSIGPFFRTADRYASLYKRMLSLPKTEGFKDLCWFGGRVLVWLPYKKVAGKTTWNHITDGSEVIWDTTLFVVDYPSTEVEEKDKCLKWYSGLLATKSSHSYAAPCEDTLSYDWSPCVTCSLPHTLGKLSKFQLNPPSHFIDKTQ